MLLERIPTEMNITSMDTESAINEQWFEASANIRELEEG